ncbi:MAG: thioredoxin family protein [Anaerolineae bacterium]
MWLRLIITAAVVGGLSLFWLGWQQYKRGLARAIRSAGAPGGKPALLYFRADYCAPCNLQQTPIVRRITRNQGNAVNVQAVDVSRQPDMARRYKVLTLPTTIVLDGGGQVRHINYGVTPQARLEAQLRDALRSQ